MFTLSAIGQEEYEYFDCSNSVFRENFADTIFTTFTNRKVKDRFTFYVPKGRIHDTFSYLEITNAAGEIIYSKRFETFLLVNGYALNEITTEAEMEYYLVNKAKTILEPDAFTYIANIVPGEGILGQKDLDEFDNFVVFLECEREKRPLFSIGLGEEDISFFGYSNKESRVVLVASCC